MIAAGAMITAFFCSGNKYKDLCAYTEKLLKIGWSDCIESAAGDADKEIVHVKLEVRTGYEEKVFGIIQDRFGQSYDIERHMIPPMQGHEFVAEIENSDILYISGIRLPIRNCKCTRDVDVYVVRDEKGQMYIYIMG